MDEKNDKINSKWNAEDEDSTIEKVPKVKKK
jgi:hypothetical protein